MADSVSLVGGVAKYAEATSSAGSKVANNIFGTGSYSATSAASGSKQESAQSERIHTIRSHAGIRTLADKSDRGSIAKIKLLTPRKDAQGSAGTNNAVMTKLARAAMVEGTYAKFLLTNVQFSSAEKMQVVPVFGDHEVVYTFGRHPVNVTLSGVLFDSPDCAWFQEFMHMYEGIGRSTMLAKNYELLQISLPNLLLKGSITSLSYSQESSRDTDIQFSITFLAKSYIPQVDSIPTATAGNTPSVFTRGVSLPGIEKMKALSGNVKPGSSSMLSNIRKTIDGFSNKVSTALANNPLSKLANEVQGEIISPVYGVLSSVTKLVNVTSPANIIGAYVNPLLNMKRGVLGMINQAKQVKSLVENTYSPSALKGVVKGNLGKLTGKGSMSGGAKSSSSISKTSGTLTSPPATLSASFLKSSRLGVTKHTPASLKASSKN